MRYDERDMKSMNSAFRCYPFSRALGRHLTRYVRNGVRKEVCALTSDCAGIPQEEHVPFAFPCIHFSSAVATISTW